MPSGRYIALALLVAAGFVIAAYLASHPPRDMGTVAWVCAIGLLAAILLLPSTRFGYLLYPVAFVFWAPCLEPGRRSRRAEEPAAASSRAVG